MREHDIAVIGMGCVFPGAADLAAFRYNIVNGVDAIGDLPPERWPPIRRRREEREKRLGPHRRGGFIPTPYRHDPMRFRIMPNVVRNGDIDQFILLDVVAAALADAGIDIGAGGLDTTDLVVGRGGYVSQKIMEIGLHADLLDQLTDYLGDHLPGTSPAEIDQWDAEMRRVLVSPDVDAMATAIPNLVASRAANRLDLGGVACVVDAACASSLVAVEQCVDRLRLGKSDMAIAAGLNFTQLPAFWFLFNRLQAMSATGISRPFDARADGLVLGEGAGAVVLKRATDAAAAGDRVYALIRGVGTSSDGRDVGVLAPASRGQVRALEAAYRDADIDPSTIGYLEAHGTGTVIGDQVELATIRTVFGRRTSAYPTRVLGSVKSMIGHTMPAAGMASLIKTVLALQDRLLPPSLNCEQPRTELGQTPFFITSRSRPWTLNPQNGPRRAAVNAFGFGGVNGHVVLEEAPLAVTTRAVAARRHRKRRSEPMPRPPAAVIAQETELLLFAASDAAGLASRLRRVTAFIGGAAKPPPLRDLAATLASEVCVDDGPRLALIRGGIDGLADELYALADEVTDVGVRPRTEAGIYACDCLPRNPGKIAAIFPGTTFPGLTRTLTQHLFDTCLRSPAARAVVDAVETCAATADGEPPVAHMLSPPAALPADTREQAAGRLLLLRALTERTGSRDRNFPFLGVMLANLINWHALQPLCLPLDMAVGHSLGELAALVAVGRVDQETAAAVTRHLLQQTIDEGAMAGGALAVVAAEEARINPSVEHCPGVAVAMFLAPQLLVIGGPTPTLADCCGRLRAAGLLVQELPLPPLHTPLCAGMDEQIRALTDHVRIAPKPRGLIPVYAASLAGRMPEKAAEMRECLHRILSRPVRFWQTLQRMYDDGARVFINFGSGPTGADVAAFTGDTDVLMLDTDVEATPPATQRQRVAARLFCRGIEFDVNGLFTGRDCRMINLDGDGDAEPPSPTTVELPLCRPAFPASSAPPAPARIRRCAEPRDKSPTADRRMPFLGEILAHERGRSIRTRRVLDLGEDLFLADHSFVAARDVKPLRHCLPVVPMTMSIEILAETAACLAPGLGVVGVRNVAAVRWLSLRDVDTLALEVVAQRLGAEGGVVKIQAEIFADGRSAVTAVLLFAPHYRETLTVAFSRPEHVQPFPMTPERIYGERHLFHGPLFRCLTRVRSRSDRGLHGDLRVLAPAGLFASVAAPQLLLDPVVLDGVGQLAGLFFFDRDTFILPTGIRHLEFYRPPPAPGTVVPAYVEFTRIDTATRQTRACAEVQDGAGHVWFRLDGWEDRMWPADARVQAAVRMPRQHALTKPVAIPAGPSPVAVVRLDRRGLGLRQEWVSRVYFAQEELQREPRGDATVAGGRRRQRWLRGHIAAKDAVRRWAAEAGHGTDLHPVEIVIDHSPAGAPLVAAGPFPGALPRVSITHTDRATLAAAALVAVGIDGEPREASERLELTDFATNHEVERIAALHAAAPAAGWRTRLWCAKEAVAKAAGVGLQGRPKRFEMVVSSPAGHLRVVHHDSGCEYSVTTQEVDGLIVAVATPVDT